MRGKKYSRSDYIVEFISQGNYVKVSAIDQETGREVSIVGDPKRSEKELKELAVKKLKYVMNKERGEKDDSDIIA